jgi:hypothetical protein
LNKEITHANKKENNHFSQGIGVHSQSLQNLLSAPTIKAPISKENNSND